jgi:hypothetical protein
MVNEEKGARFVERWMAESMTPEQHAATEHLQSWMAELQEKAEADLAVMGQPQHICIAY